MLGKAAQKITDKMILNDVILQEDRELYEYGMVQGVILIINWLTAILIGVCFGMFWQPVVFLFLFTVVRIYAGGFHAGTQLQCYIYTSALQFVVMAAIKYLSISVLAYIILVGIAAVCLFFIAPVEAENKPMTAEEHQKYGRIARRNWCLEVGLLLVCYFLQWDMMCRCITVNFALLSILLILGKIEEKRRLTNK